MSHVDASGDRDGAAAARDRRWRFLAPLLPVVVVFLVLARLLESPRAALVVLALLGSSALPGAAAYRVLRPGAGSMESCAGAVALGLVFMTGGFVAMELAGWRDPWALAGALAVVGVAALALLPRRMRRGGRPARWWAWVWLAALLAVAAAMYLPPSLSFGAELPDGSRAFVKNFGFDFLRHLTFTASTVQGPLPPRNFFSDGKKAESYWLFYAVPAQLGRALGPRAELSRVLLCYNFALLSVFLTFLMARMSNGWRGALGAGLGATVFWAAGSLRGVAHLVPPLSRFLETETKFVFTSPLYFSLFMAHHLFAILLLLVVMALYNPGDRRRPCVGPLAAGLLLPVIFVTSPFIGVIAGVWFAALTLWAVVRRGSRRRLALISAAFAILPGLLGGAAYVALFGAGFDLRRYSNLEAVLDLRVGSLPAHLALCMGPLLLLAGAGLTRRRLRAAGTVSVLILALSSLLLAALLVVRAPSIEETTHEVATKAGMVLMVALAFFTAAGAARVARRWRRRVPGTRRGRERVLRAASALALCGGVVTSAAYVRAYSDVSSARTISGGDWRAALWVKENLPPGARLIVGVSQPYGPRNYSFVPPLAERQVLRGMKGIFLRGTGSLLNDLDALYRGDPEVVRKWAASRAGWYVFCGGEERAINPDVIRALDGYPEFLEPVYEEEGVKIYRFREQAP